MADVKRLARIRQSELNEDHNGVVTFSEQWLAELTSFVGVSTAIRKATPNLQRWQPHPDEPAALVTRFAYKQRRHSLIFDIDVDYSTNPGDQDSPSPLERPAVIEGGSVELQEAIFVDSQKKPLVNTAGQFLEGAVETYSFSTFSVTKMISTNWPGWFLDYNQSVNSDPIRIRGLTCLPRTLKIGSISIGSDQVEDDVEFCRLQLQLIYNENTWDKFYLNRGYEEAVYHERTMWIPNYVEPQKVIFRTLQRCLNSQGDLVTEPVFLNEDGRRPRVDAQGNLITLQDEYDAMKRGLKLESTIKDPLDPEDIVILRFGQRKERPFYELPLA